MKRKEEEKKKKAKVKRRHSNLHRLIQPNETNLLWSQNVQFPRLLLVACLLKNFPNTKHLLLFSPSITCKFFKKKKNQARNFGFGLWLVV